ncbi:zinc-binding dehydrogenase [Streptomyces sp. CHA1]|uniref:zinc-binding dehydrogenase n=1 Tax=unclassified Streptomyces TaxID=2593676 RepID=UPI001BFCBA4A|nr:MULTISPECIES: zinc-binding dehydrogenase [unclassified Streptomyces]MBT3159907.1 zinc-binding dehydrogenase [Streptomyces sp. G11C]MCO6701748.1 zinc-binding dehydrogenase [Streptomyces sp. CHB9.2]MCO6708100.1 zinc-binding dehydrogenase [Streptomyces sp. CHA3]MCO6714422.1 zinc-binding dehydrogenase [Streptomyces sp. CHB19.2]MCO6720260.1 zinc-binding dehydrogenase [Streptomyces sp. Vc714c-19]
MKAVVMHEYGGPEVLRYEEVPDPVPGPGEVRIAVRASGVHFVEGHLRAGGSEGLPPAPELPAIMGSESAGTVDAVGDGVGAEWLGRRVVTRSPSPGGYASLVTSPVSELHQLPDSLGYEAAVTLIGTGAITLDFLDQVAPAPEDVLLVLSAAGGIGRLAVPHVRRLGTTVIGAAGGPAKTATVRGLGADLAVDYDQPAWSDEVRAHFGTGRPVTAVLDGVGGAKAAEAYGLLADGGRLVTIGCASGEWFAPDPEEAAARSVEVIPAIARWAASDVDRSLSRTRALDAGAHGSLKAAYQTFALSDAAHAHAEMAARRTAGKVVLLP